MMKLNILAILVFFSTWSAMALTEIRVPETIEVSRRSELNLFDIVQVKSAKVEILQLLKLQEVKSPDLKGIHRALRAFGDKINASELLRVFVPEKIQVTQVEQFSEKEFQRKLANHLYAMCVDCEIQIQTKNSRMNQIGPNWDTNWDEVKLQGSFMVAIKDLRQVDPSMPDKWLSVQLKIFRNVLQAKRTISAQERVNSDDFFWKKMEVTYFKENLLAKEDLVQFPLAARMIPQGKIIGAADLRKELAAIRGQILKVLINEGDLEVSTQMTAEDNGSVGDLIKIRSLDNKKVTSGELIEKSTARIR